MITNLSKLGTNFDVFPVGYPFPIYPGMDIPDQSKYIILSKDNPGGYNTGKVTNQQSPFLANTNNGVRRYTVEIIGDIDDPLYGQTIELINSREVRNTAGTWFNVPTLLGAMGSYTSRENKFQEHWKSGINLLNGNANNAGVNTSGASFTFDFQNSIVTTSITDNSNYTPRTGVSTEADTLDTTYYMRIK
jgi:hypothetical protein